MGAKIQHVRAKRQARQRLLRVEQIRIQVLRHCFNVQMPGNTAVRKEHLQRQRLWRLLQEFPHWHD